MIAVYALPSRVLPFIAAAVGLLLVVGSLTLWARRTGDLALITALVSLGAIGVAWNGLPRLESIGPFAVGLAFFDVAFVAALLMLAVGSLRRRIVVPVPSWLLLAAGGLLTASLLATLFGGDVVESTTVGYLAKVGKAQPTSESDLVATFRLGLALFVVPVLIATVTSSWGRATVIADIWVASAAVSAGVALLDLVTAVGVGEAVTGVPWREGQEAGLAVHPTHLALSCGMALPVALGSVGFGRGSRRAIAMVMSALLGLGMLASASRVGLLGVPVAIMLALLLLPFRRTLFLAVLVGGLFAAGGTTLVLAAQPSLLGVDRLIGNDPSAAASNTARLDEIEVSLANIEAYPLTGVGFGAARRAHNLYLQFLESSGIVGLAAFLAFVWGVVSLGWHLRRSTSGVPPEGRQLAGALLAALGIWLFSGLVQSPIVDRYIYVPVGVVIGLSVAARRNQAIPTGDPVAAASPGPPLKPISSSYAKPGV